MASISAAAPDISKLRAQFQLPANRVDYETAKLVVDQLIDPSTDAPEVRRKIAQWELAVRSNLPAQPTERQTIDAIIKTLYKPGPWNQGRPFSYDLSDPLGRNLKNKQLETYLATRKGNCVSMPVLFVILAQKFSLPVALATAPRHVMVKFADDSQQAWVNIEATSGGFKYDTSYESETGISEKAVENGLYLRPLSPVEGVGVIAGTLMEHYAAKKDGNALMAVADLAISVNPRDPVAMMSKANAYYLQTQNEFIRKYPDPADVPAELHDEYRRLTRENLAWFEKLESLGWSQGTVAQQRTYLETIRREAQRRGIYD